MREAQRWSCAVFSCGCGCWEPCVAAEQAGWQMMPTLRSAFPGYGIPAGLAGVRLRRFLQSG